MLVHRNMNAVLVHGIFNISRVFFLMRKSLEAHGIAFFTPELRPKDGKYGIEDLANKLDTEISNNLGEKQNFIIIPFRMGKRLNLYLKLTRSVLCLEKM
jgi:triacylglycerol lipase